MKANELRIGNLVYNIYDKEESIQSVQDFFDQYPVKLINSQPLTNFNPIPLTPEILEKAGFQRMVDLFRLDLFSCYTKHGHFEYYDGSISVNLKHLHQLQNLYFALTGTELEINLNP